MSVAAEKINPELDFDLDIAGFTDRQLEVCTALDDGYKFILYGGALGGGKSYLLRWIAVRILFKIFSKYGLTNVPVMLASEDYPTLKDRQISKIIREFPAWLGNYHDDHKAHGKCFILAPEYGSGIICLRNLDDPSKYQSAEFAAILVDELTKNPLQTFTDLRMRLRWPGIPDRECAFIGATNPGGIGHCVPHGDVLTPDGWIDIKDVRVGDSVYTVTKDGSLIVSVVSQVHQEHYSGQLVNVSARGLNIVCTPNHSIAKRGGVRDGKNTRDKVSDWLSLVPFKDLPGQATVVRSPLSWDGTPIVSFSPEEYPQRKAKKPQPASIHGDDYAELMGWMLSEGFGNNGETSKVTKTWGIAQSKPEQREKIQALLDRCGFHYHASKTAFVLYGNSWWNWAVGLGKCREKRIPKALRNASRDQLQILLNALVDGDGHWSIRGQSGQYYTIGKRLADDVSEICLKLGLCVHTSFRQRDNREGLSYCINFKRVSSHGTELLTGNHCYGVDTETKRKSDIQYTDYDGDVFCLGIPETHSFVIRQNGSVWVSGNSYCKAYWIDKTFPPEFISPIDYRGLFKFIPSKADDNPHLDASYWQVLSTLPENLRQAFRDGSWDVYQGQAFTFSREYHVLKQAIPIPRYAPLYSTFDWGFGAPFSWQWWWVDADGRGYMFSEFYGWNGTPNQGLRWEDSRVAREIKKKEAELAERYNISFDKCIRLAGPDCFQKKPDYKGGGQGKSTAEEFSAYGIHLQPGDPSRSLKIRQFRERIRIPEDGTMPMLMVYPECDSFIRCIPDIPVDKNNPEEVDTKAEDHEFDAACHFCMARPISLKVPEPAKDAAQKHIEHIMKGTSRGYEEAVLREQHMQNVMLNREKSRSEGRTYSDVDGR